MRRSVQHIDDDNEVDGAAYTCRCERDKQRFKQNLFMQHVSGDGSNDEKLPNSYLSIPKRTAQEVEGIHVTCVLLPKHQFFLFLPS